MPLELFGSEGRELRFGERWFRVYSAPHEFSVDKRIAEKTVFGTDKQEQLERITMLIFRENTDYKHLKETFEMSCFRALKRATALPFPLRSTRKWRSILLINTPFCRR